MHLRHRGARRLLKALPLAIGAIVLSASAAAAAPWATDPASDNSNLVSQLFWLTLVLAAVVFFLVEGLLIYSSLRFRRRAAVPTHEPPQIHGNTRLEVMWAVVPAVILIGLFGVSVRTMSVLASPPENAMRVQVEAFQFGWNFSYNDGAVKTSNEMAIPVGVPVVFEVHSRDVIHSFWVPQLGGKIDAVPGKVNQIFWTAQQAGKFRGVCAELCGAAHANMLFSVEAMPEAAFNEWLANGGKSAAQAAAAPVGDTAKGAALFASNGCVACHTISGVTGAVGTIGPNLNDVGTRAATREPGVSAETYLRESLTEPAKFVVPTYAAIMPSFSTLPPADLDALVAFLASQK